MLSIQVLATILLFARVGSQYYIYKVLKQQHALLKAPLNPVLMPISKTLIRFRRVLFGLSIVIFLGNIVPMIIDIISMLGIDQGRPANVRPISLAYAFSNALVAFVSSYLIHTLYRLAAADSDITAELIAKTYKLDKSDTIKSDK